MDRNQAIQHIRDNPEEVLRKLDVERDRSGKGYICPGCKSGSGKTGTGITIKGQHLQCWAKGCVDGDIFDFIGVDYGTNDFNMQLDIACRAMGLTIDPSPGQNSSISVKPSQPKPLSEKEKDPESVTRAIVERKRLNQDQEQDQGPDYTAFYTQCRNRINQTSYPELRGLSEETLQHFNVGYDPEWVNPARKDVPASPRLIIPISKSCYFARSVLAVDDRFSKMQVGKRQFLNVRALEESEQPIFIVEGEIDALSVYQAGGEPIALSGTQNVQKFLEVVKKTPPKVPLIIALDNDEYGNEASKKLEEGLRDLDITYYWNKDNYVFGDGFKDANEALVENEENLSKCIERAEIEAFRIAEIEQILKRAELEQESVSNNFDTFKKVISENSQNRVIPTGFSNLDKLLDGGLYPGLYIVGAVSSLGKTSLCLQIADQIAKAGKDVLFFSLEMSQFELMAKSVSRLTFLADERIYKETINAKTTRGVLNWGRNSHNQAEQDVLNTAMEEYYSYSKRLFITQGVGNVNVALIREKIQRHIKITGEPPVVIIDYLQIVAPDALDNRATDKQIMDKSVLEMKRLSRDYNIPIIGISSFNRDNYTAPVNMTAFKESGAIEYSSDVLIGLQYDGMDYQEVESSTTRDKRIRELIQDNIDKAKGGIPQQIQVKILKHRNGTKGDCLLDYWPMFNYFVESKAEIEQQPQPKEWEKWKRSV